jgi:hypothetical protein
MTSNTRLVEEKVKAGKTESVIHSRNYPDGDYRLHGIVATQLAPRKRKPYRKNVSNSENRC